MHRLLLLTLLLPSTLLASPPSEPQRDPFLAQYALTRRFTSGRPVQPEITPDDKTILFLRGQPTANKQALFAFDVATATTTELLTPEAILKGAEETLSAAEKARRERMRVSSRGFSGYQLSEDGAQILVTLSGKAYVVQRASGQVTELKNSAGALDPHFSPDAKHVAYVRDHNVFQVDLATGREQRVTMGGTAQKPLGMAEFVAQEEMGRMAGYWWSPDSQFIAFAEVDTAQVEKLAIVDVMHPENPAETMAYPRPGKANAVVRLGIAKAKGGKVVWLQWDAAQFPYLATVAWQHGGPLTLVVQNRAQTAEQVLAVDPRTGATRVLLTETDAAWLNLHQDFPRWFDDGHGFLWCTERNGGPEIVEYQADGQLKRTWVKSDFGLRGMTRWVDKAQTLYFAAETDPTQSHIWRVTDAGTPVRVQTGEMGPANEFAAAVAKSGALLVAVTQSDLAMPSARVLRADGTRVAELPSLVQGPPFVVVPTFFTLGQEAFHAVLFRPRSAPLGTKLPTILSVYGGPTATVVRHSLRENLMDQWLADQGYLVVRIDGRGTPLRTSAWLRAVHLDFATVPLDDQVTAVRELAKQVPELDLTRLGIYGWSFGGYLAALAVLKRPDVFKAAVAGAPVVDWSDYDTHYTERYLGLPTEHPEAYEKSSLLTYAQDPQRAISSLLLIHGSADDNVYFFHSLKLSNALFLAGKPHELLPLSGLTHMVPDPLVTQREYERMLTFFRARL